MVDMFPEDMPIEQIFQQFDEVLDLGLESISIATTLSDFMMSVVLRTARNIKNVVTGNKAYPLDVFSDKHRAVLPKILSGKQLTLGKNILPCPPGMLQTYSTTGKVLLESIKESGFTHAVSTLSALQAAVLRSDRITLIELHKSLVKLPDPDTLRDKVTALYKSHGLAYRTAESLYSATTDVQIVYNQVGEFHHVIADITKLANMVSRFTKITPKTDLQKDVYHLANQIVRHVASTCHLAYVVLERMLTFEHNYVRCLEVFYRQVKAA